MSIGVIGDYAFHWMGEDDPDLWNIRWKGSFISWDYETGCDGSEYPDDDMCDKCNEWFENMMETFVVPEMFNESEMMYCYVSYDPEGGTEARLEGVNKDGVEFVYFIEEEDGKYT